MADPRVFLGRRVIQRKQNGVGSAIHHEDPADVEWSIRRWAVIGRSNENVRDAVAIDIARRRQCGAELTAELQRLDLLKLRVIELGDHAQIGTAEDPDFSNILGWAKAGVDVAEITILVGRSDGEIGNSVTIDVTDVCDPASKKRSGIFRFRIKQRCRLDRGDEER